MANDVRPAPSDDRQRAVRLLSGGALGGHAGALVVTVVCFVLGGVSAGVSCVVACVVTLAFYIIGQAVQVIVADAPPTTVLVAALASYGIRVGALSGLLILALGAPERIAFLDPTPVVAGTITVVVSWLAAEIFTFSRLRVPIFETPPGNH